MRVCSWCLKVDCITIMHKGKGGNFYLCHQCHEPFQRFQSPTKCDTNDPRSELQARFHSMKNGEYSV